ncbi:DUF1310 family protein [Xylocopilactobacillus apicola]|nr:DUF1310 family protein [Xylocopilactobacillus apicola]
MFKWIKRQRIISIVLVVIVVIGLMVRGAINMKKESDRKFQEEMVKEVKKNEKRIERFVRSSDENKVVKTITIDYDSIEHNPMGGVMVDGYVNGDKELSFGVIISNNYVGDKREYNISGGISSKLDDFMTGDTN